MQLSDLIKRLCTVGPPVRLVFDYTFDYPSEHCPIPIIKFIAEYGDSKAICSRRGWQLEDGLDDAELDWDVSRIMADAVNREYQRTKEQENEPT